MARNRAKDQSDNYLVRVPVRAVGFEEGEEGLLVLLRPKFLKGPLAWWLQPRLPRPFFRVKLDEIGTLVWNSIDGARNVGQIAEIVAARFGERVEPRYERVSRFVYSLHQGAMITFAERPAGDEGG